MRGQITDTSCRYIKKRSCPCLFKGTFIWSMIFTTYNYDPPEPFLDVSDSFVERIPFDPWTNRNFMIFCCFFSDRFKVARGMTKLANGGNKIPLWISESNGMWLSTNTVPCGHDRWVKLPRISPIGFGLAISKNQIALSSPRRCPLQPGIYKTL